MSQVIFLEKKFNSESHTKKRFNSLSHIREKKFNPLSRVREFQFFESYSKKVQCRKKSHIQKKINSVSRNLYFKNFHFESHSERMDQFFDYFLSNFF